jgi:LuxR family maltose regulon positive regulatory protein
MPRASAPTTPTDVPAFTARERQVLELLPTYLSIGAIGATLGMRRSTAKTHVANIYRKLHASRRAEAVEQARRSSILPPLGRG